MVSRSANTSGVGVGVAGALVGVAVGGTGVSVGGTGVLVGGRAVNVAVGAGAAVVGAIVGAAVSCGMVVGDGECAAHPTSARSRNKRTAITDMTNWGTNFIFVVNIA